MNQIAVGNCLDILNEWASAGVKAQTCITSPPYYGLRDYGAVGQIGLEGSPDDYIDALVKVFRAVRDCLAADGTLWVNIGDSYASNPASGGVQSSKMTGGEHKRTPSNVPYKRPEGCKPKDMVGIPWLLALALRSDGWYLRQDIIWHKPNAMPESVRDRCTKAHEYIFLLSKSEKYLFNHHSVQENTTDGASKRNRRSVWSVPTKAYRGAHFAVFPEQLVELCILAGSNPGDTVLDPFLGSGTTASAAVKAGRMYMGCDINPAYRELQMARISRASATVEPM